MFIKGEDFKTPEIKGKTFFARVVSNTDPLNKQRIQFRIKGLHRGIPDDKLPWAAPEVSLNYAISFRLPPSGSVVKIFYLDEYSALYSTTLITEYNENLTKIGGLTNTQVKYVDYAGNYLFVDNTNGNFIFKHLSGAQIQIDQNGNVTLNCESLSVFSNTSEIDATTLNLKATNMNLDASTLNVNASTLNLNGGTTTVNSNNLTLGASGSVSVKSSSLTLGASGSVTLNGAGMTLSSSGSVAVNAASFNLAAGFNLVPVMGWATPPVPSPGSAGQAGPAPSAPSAPVAPTIAPETSPVFTAFTGKIDY